MTFQQIWQAIQFNLVEGLEVPNWTAAKGYFGQSFLIVAVSPSHVNIHSPNSKRIQKVSKVDFEFMHNNWDEYCSHRIKRKDISKKTRVSRYTISILHYIEVNFSTELGGPIALYRGEPSDYIKPITSSDVGNEEKSSILDLLMISTSDEVKKIGFDEVKNKLISFSGLNGLLKIETVDDLLEAIRALRKVRAITSIDNYFISEIRRKEYFLLNHVAGSAGDKEIGITPQHYMDKEKATEWRRNLLRIFNADFPSPEVVADANVISGKIHKIYNRLVGKA